MSQKTTTTTKYCCKIISLMSGRHYPVRRMKCALMVNNAGYKQAAPLQFTSFIQHDIPVNTDLPRFTFILLRICWPLLCAHYLTALKCHQRQRDSWIPCCVQTDKECENVNIFFFFPGTKPSLSSLVCSCGVRSTFHHYNEGGSIRQGLQLAF